jgi:hypothetical protein
MNTFSGVIAVLGESNKGITNASKCLSLISKIAEPLTLVSDFLSTAKGIRVGAILFQVSTVIEALLVLFYFK